MHETESFSRSFSPSPVQATVFQAWQEQRAIWWGQLFKGRLSSKWGEAQGCYYKDNPDTRDSNHFSARTWSSKVIGKLIEIALELWDTRNKVLHGITIEEQNKIQRLQAIQTVTRKFLEGNRSLRASYPRLYMETCQKLCDKPTLQLLKWIATFSVCRASLSKDRILKRRRILKEI